MTRVGVVPRCGSPRWLRQRDLVLSIVSVALIIVVTTSCFCFVVDRGTRLTVENRLPVDVTITYYEVRQDGSRTASSNMGIVSSGQVTLLDKGIALGGIGGVPRVVLRAEDPLGNVTWQRSWTGKEFSKLKDVGWRIVVSPETSSP